MPLFRDADPDKALAAEAPALSVWFDLEHGAEHRLDPGTGAPDGSGTGFMWVDLEASGAADAALLEAGGYLPPRLLMRESSASSVAWSSSADYVHLALAGARLEGAVLRLDRRHIIVTPGLLTSVHTGQPDYVHRLRERYQDSLANFAKSHGFLLFEMTGLLIDDLQAVVRDLGDLIDELRIAHASSGDVKDANRGSDLLAAVLLARRILVGTRDVLIEVSTRRSVLIPETTQPYLRDTASRIDGMLDDLAFSRDVLSEAMRSRPPDPPASEPTQTANAVAEPPTGTLERPPLRFMSLGGFQVLSGAQTIPGTLFGPGHARELLSALLATRRTVGRADLLRWFWSDLDEDRGEHALRTTVAQLRLALEPNGEGELNASIVQSEGDGYRLLLRQPDSWDVQDLLDSVAGASGIDSPADRVAPLLASLTAAESPLFPEWPYAEWLSELRRDYEAATVAIRSSLAEAVLAGGEPATALEHFQKLLDAAPEREAWHRGIMRCHAATGERPLALRQFHTCRSILRQSQGAEPSPETHALYLELLKTNQDKD